MYVLTVTHHKRKIYDLKDKADKDIQYHRIKHHKSTSFFFIY